MPGVVCHCQDSGLRGQGDLVQRPYAGCSSEREGGKPRHYRYRNKSGLTRQADDTRKATFHPPYAWGGEGGPEWGRRARLPWTSKM